MSGLEVNKILASIILAILVVTVIGHLGDIYMYIVFSAAGKSFAFFSNIL